MKLVAALGLTLSVNALSFERNVRDEVADTRGDRDNADRRGGDARSDRDVRPADDTRRGDAPAPRAGDREDDRKDGYRGQKTRVPFDATQEGTRQEPAPKVEDHKPEPLRQGDRVEVYSHVLKEWCRNGVISSPTEIEYTCPCRPGSLNCNDGEMIRYRDYYKNLEQMSKDETVRISKEQNYSAR